MRRRPAVILVVLALLALVASPTAGAETEESVQLTQVNGPYYGAGPIAAGPEGAIWFLAGKSLGRLAAEGTVTETPLSEQMAAREIVAGPEGDLWIARKNEVDRITTKGAVSRHPAPIEGKVRHLGFDSRGRLWFTIWTEKWSRHSERHFGKAYVVRLGADGEMAKFPVPGKAKLRDEDLGWIGAGPGGDIWFTDPSLDRLGKVAPDGKVIEYSGRIAPQRLVPWRDGHAWVIGDNGVGTVDTAGRVRVLRRGTLDGFGIGGGSYGATVDGDGNLWWIGEVTRVLRMTPGGQVSVVRGPGAPAAESIATSSDGSIWVSTALGIKGAVEAPLLHYEGGEPALEVQKGTSVVRAGKFTVGLACGGTTGGCSGSLVVYERDGHNVGRGRFSLGVEAAGRATVTLTPEARKELARNSYLGVTVVSDEGEYSEGHAAGIVLRVPHPRPPWAGRPLVMPLVEGQTARNPVFGPGGDIWFGSGNGRFGRLSLDGRLSTVKAPGLSAVPTPISSRSRRYVWFTVEHESGFTYRETESVIGRVDATGHLRMFRLPAGPEIVGAEVAPDGTVWVARDRYPHPGRLDRLSPDGEVRRFRIGAEPSAVLAGRAGGVWLATAGPVITHIAADGRRRDFDVPHKGFVDGLTFGRDGSIWFTHAKRGRLPSAIGHISREGRLSERSTPDAAWLGAIVADRRGNLWWAQASPSRIGRLRPGGKPKLMRRGAAAGGSAVLGPEGDVWFTAGYEDQVAIFHP